MEKIIEQLVALFAEIPADSFDRAMEVALKVAFPGPMKSTQVEAKTDFGVMKFDYLEPNSIWECIGADGVALCFRHLANERRSTAASKFRAGMDLKKAIKKAPADVQAQIAALLAGKK